MNYHTHVNNFWWRCDGKGNAIHQLLTIGMSDDAPCSCPGRHAAAERQDLAHMIKAFEMKRGSWLNIKSSN